MAAAVARTGCTEAFCAPPAGWDQTVDLELALDEHEVQEDRERSDDAAVLADPQIDEALGMRT